MEEGELELGTGALGHKQQLHSKLGLYVFLLLLEANLGKEKAGHSLERVAKGRYYVSLLI